MRTRTARNSFYGFPTATHWTLGCDANDPHTLAAFWANALGYVAEPGYEDPDGASIVDPAGKGPAIGWLRVSEGSQRRIGSISTSEWQAKARGTWSSGND